MAKYRILVGRHIQRDKDGIERTYSAGDVCESEINLCERFDTPGISPKFQKLEGEDEVVKARSELAKLNEQIAVARAAKAGFDPKTSNTDQAAKTAAFRKTLEAMTVKELQDHAASEEIDTRGSAKKDELIRLILQAPH